MLLAAEQCGLAPEELAAGEAVLKEAQLKGGWGFWGLGFRVLGVIV